MHMSDPESAALRSALSTSDGTLGLGGVNEFIGTTPSLKGFYVLFGVLGVPGPFPGPPDGQTGKACHHIVLDHVVSLRNTGMTGPSNGPHGWTWDNSDFE